MKISTEAAQKYPALEEMVQWYSRRMEKTVFWEDKVHAELEIVEALPNKLIWNFNVTEKHCNQLGNIHGGCVATIIDICSSFAILTYEGKGGWKLIGVSTDLAVSYMSGIAAGQTARLECEVQRVGKSLANIYTKVYNDQGKLCYSGSHTKYSIDSRL
ncbi:HotDog domain-containing protein [Zychaea mexicana]|uniref:HotDog domain-containing protein n=1 Tax=Zychaea mexicana TaxID=64656 RepID=UPI0022FDE54F|nr:HotDog domain-containing protein [Zychaea mexicana]KAI9496179.1 HotDog domain-containing protein [Zychaea mexicana]